LLIQKRLSEGNNTDTTINKIASNTILAIATTLGMLSALGIIKKVIDLKEYETIKPFPLNAMFQLLNKINLNWKKTDCRNICDNNYPNIAESGYLDAIIIETPKKEIGDD
jgi:hypothetical protein